MPPPDPIGEYETLYPYADPSAGIHFETSGKTNELPAPLSDVSCFFAGRRACGPDRECGRDHGGRDEHEPKSSLHDLTLSLDCHWRAVVVSGASRELPGGSVEWAEIR